MSNNDRKNTGLSFLDGFQGIKFGSGVLGKTSTIAGMLLFCAIAAMYFLREIPLMVGLIFFAMFIFIAVYIALSFWYASKHPSTAVLEGAELVRYHELELAAKDPGIIEITANTGSPKALSMENRYE